MGTVEKRPIRLVGITLSGFTDSDYRQLSIGDIDGQETRKEALDKALLDLQRKYGGGVVMTGDEMIAEKRFEAGD